MSADPRDTPTTTAPAPPALGGIAHALWVQAEGRRAAAELRTAGIPVLLLKGPDLQTRLYGTPAAYASGDVDVLIPPRMAPRARGVLARAGWTFSPDNGVLWRYSRAAAFDREGFRLDLHWGLHAAHLPAWSLRSLERRLWEGARIGPSGMREPDAESLVVFLAVHVVGHGFERAQWAENVHRAATLPHDQNEMWAIARRARVEGAVRAALTDERNAATPVLDGAWGRAVTVATWIGRGHFLPEPTRARMRESVALAREGFGFWAPWRRDVWETEGSPVVTPAGVFRAWDLSGELADAGLEAIRERPAPLVVDVGTGSGPVALVVARRRPDATVVGIDASPRAVGAARRNAVRGGDSRTRFVTGDLLGPIPPRLRGRVDLVVSNIPTDPPSVKGSRGDPRRTLVGPGADGLGLAWSLIEQARDVLRPGGRVVLMLRDWQIDSMRARVEAMGFDEVSTTPCRVRPHSFWCVEREGSDR